MSFREKSTIATLAATILVYGWYFFNMIEIAETESGPVEMSVIATHFITAVVAVIVISIMSHIAIAIITKRVEGEVEDAGDERDKLIELRGESKGSVILAFGIVFTIGMILLENSAFALANSLLAWLVLSEIVKCAFKLLDYRRGI